MAAIFNPDIVKSLRERLYQHPIYGAVRSLEDVQLFMAHHIYSVWDFMSLVKYLQRQIAPTEIPWTPKGHPSARYFINSLVAEEESDEGLPDANGKLTYSSHFELYCKAMSEVGADPSKPLRFIELVRDQGVREALASELVPEASRRFTTTTFDFIDQNKPHVVAAALAMGREHIIPNMFRALLKELGVTPREAPAFHYYLNRHIHLDEDFHGPLSLLLLNDLCGEDPDKVKEAEAAACQALEARIAFWDGVREALEAVRS